MTHKKKILIVSNNLKNTENGVAKFTQNLIVRLSSTFKLEVLTSENEIIELQNVKVIGVKSLFFDVSNRNWFSTSLRINKLDLTVYDLILYCDAREALFCRNKQTQQIGVIHDFYSFEYGNNKILLKDFFSDWLIRKSYYRAMAVLERITYKKLSSLVAVCEYTRNKVDKEISIQDKCTVIRNGIQISDVFESNNNRSIDVLFVGGNFERKGVYNLLNAIKELKQQGQELIVKIIGRDKKIDVFLTLVMEYDLSANVEFLGGLSNEKVKILMSDSKVFCMPSLFESYAYTYLEALASGCAVVISSQCGTTEIKEYYSQLFEVDPFSPQDISKGITMALQCSNYEKDMSHISIERMIKSYVDVIEKTV